MEIDKNFREFIELLNEYKVESERKFDCRNSIKKVYLKPSNEKRTSIRSIENR